jgi:hypothetical protein
MSEFDKMLEDVAREWDLHACGDDTCELEGADCLAGYLKRRLRPLLEAGQAMYYALDGKGNSQVEIEWDAAKQAAMEGRS